MATYKYNEHRVEFVGIRDGCPEFELFRVGQRIGAGIVVNALDSVGEGAFFVDYKPTVTSGYSLPVAVLSFIEASAYEFWRESGSSDL